MMEEIFCAALKTSPDELLCLVVRSQSRPNKAALKAAIHKSSKKQAMSLCGALACFADLQVQAFQNLDNAQFEHTDSFKTPSPRPKRRKSARQGQGNSSNSRQAFVLVNLKACATVAHLALSHPLKAFQPCDLFPTVKTLHDQLVFFEDDLELQDTVTMLCEAWWRDHLPGRESLIAQSLPFLLSKSLEAGRKVNVHRVYAMREAFTLFDFVDESIEDLKHLLMRCVLTPAYLRSPDGCRFISFLFNINVQLTKELIVMVRSQIPFGRKSILEAYGEILFRAWRTASGPCLQEIQESCVQGLIEGAIYASSKTLASSVRKVLGGFTAQRTQEGVEALLFRFQEPILFRSLQVANSNVRRNALLLLIDMFPLEDPNVSKEENDILVDKQFNFLEKLLSDPCPDVRITAVEGVCRVLRLFWEVVSSGTTVKLLSKVVDETAQDKSNTAVRCAVLQGVTYLLENPASHELLRVLLPRLGPLLTDCNLAVRIAVTDMILAIKGIRAIPFLTVVSLEALLSTLETDKPPVARRLTKLLIPSYFPSKVPLAEACNRCVALIKRSPQAGARFCEWAMAEGVSPSSLLELVRVFVALLSSSEGFDAEGQEGIFSALNQLCHSLANQKELKVVLGELLTRETLKSLLRNAATSTSRTSIVHLVSVITPTNVPELFEYCTQLVTNFTIDALSSINCNEARAVHSLMLAWGGFNDLIQALVRVLTENAVRTEDIVKLSNNGQNSKRNRSESKSGKSPWTKSMKKSCTSGKGKKGADYSEQCQSIKNLINAVGASWHVENLLEMDETRQAVLAHESLPVLVSGLRSTVHSVMHSSLEFPVSDFLKASPIRAYAALMVHMALTKKGVKRASIAASKESMLDQEDPIMGVCKDLVEWTKSLQSSSQPSNLVIHVKREAKRARNSQSRSREPLTDISNNTPCGACSNGFSEAEVFLTRVKLSNTSLESLLYFFSLKLVKDNAVQDACLEFAMKLMQWIMGWLRAWEGQKLEAWKQESGVKLKGLLTCVRSSATHAAKMLYLSLRNDTERALQYADLSNHLLDLVVFSDCLFGSKGAMSLLTALKPWIPDLFISVASSVRAMTMEECRAGASSYCIDDLVRLGKRSSRPWVASFANSVFQTMDFEQENQENQASSPIVANAHDIPADSQEPGESSQSAAVLKVERRPFFSINFLNKVSKLLRRGDPVVLEGVLSLFLWHAAMSLKSDDYCNVVGSLDIICRRFHSKKGLKRTLSGPFITACEEISKHVDSILEEKGTSGSQSQRKTLHKAKELLQNLLLIHRGVES